ncbi:MAG: oligosaccharide flippase family protein, partial [Bacteroidota bacterium]|nr:oligosaccharide flippase family protein [Bacteroidota bacterium]
MLRKLLYSNTSWSLLSNGATALLGFVNLAFIARQFSQADAGKWFMLLTVYTLLEMLRSGWVQTPFVRYFVVAKTEEERGHLIGASWQLLLGFTVVLSLVAGIVFYCISYRSVTYSLAFQMAIVWLFATLPYQLLQWQLQAKSWFKKLAIVRLLFPFSFAVLLLLQLKLKLSIETLAVIYAMLQLVAGLIGFITGWLQFGSWKKEAKQKRKQLSGFGKFSMLTMVTANLLRSSDQFIIASFLGPAAVAVYSIPQKLIEAIEIPVRSFASVAVPKATSLWQNEKGQQLRRFFYSQCGMLTALILPLLLTLLLFPSFIVSLLGGGKYQQSSLVLQIFCFYAILLPLDRYCG